MNYTVFDVETANSQRDSICSIGIIRYEDNQIVYEKEIRMNPETEFNYFNIRIHGIRPADVAHAPTFPEVWKEIKCYFENTILVAHNAKSMDLCALYRTLERYHLPMVNNQYICTMELAKKIFKNDDSVQSYRLDALSQKFNIKLLHHHNALDDTRACFEILKKFEELYPEQVRYQQYIFGKAKNSLCCGNPLEKKENSVKNGKLVRDKIPQIIIADGKKPITRILDDEEYLKELDKKLNEEIAEYQQDKSIQEMADVLEVLFAICEARGHSVEQLMEVRNEKRNARGGFEEKIFWSGNEPCN